MSSPPGNATSLLADLVLAPAQDLGLAQLLARVGETRLPAP